MAVSPKVTQYPIINGMYYTNDKRIWSKSNLYTVLNVTIKFLLLQAVDYIKM